MDDRNGNLPFVGMGRTVEVEVDEILPFPAAITACVKHPINKKK